MDLARAGHAYVFCLEVATPSTTAHNKLYISADSWDSLVVWRRCFEANSKLKSDFQDDSKTEENVLKGMRLLSKGIKIGTAIGGIAAAVRDLDITSRVNFRSDTDATLTVYCSNIAVLRSNIGRIPHSYMERYSPLETCALCKPCLHPALHSQIPTKCKYFANAKCK